MTDHTFNPFIAKKYGINTAVLLEQLYFLILSDKHIHDDLCWTYNTLDSLGDIFPYWSRHQLERAINNAVKDGLLVKGNYNQSKYDRTLWYALTPKACEYYPEISVHEGVGA